MTVATACFNLASKGKEAGPSARCRAASVPRTAVCQGARIYARPVFRAFTVAAILAYLGFSASAVRYTDDGLREATKSRSNVVNLGQYRTPVFVPVRRPTLHLPDAPGGVLVAYSPPRQRFHRCLFFMEPDGLQPGSDALGVSMPRRLRWAVLGGHGRHGPGAPA